MRHKKPPVTASRAVRHVCDRVPELTAEQRAYLPDHAPVAQHLALMLSKTWGASANITVGFTEPTSVEMRNKILLYANKWSEASGGGNVKFSWVASNPMVRVTFKGDGYWSYLGRDILGIPKNQPTMCFQDFSLSTPESEWNRVVPHEFGHTLGFPHEHLRAEIIALLDRAKTIAYFERTQGWSESDVVAQVLTPLSPSSIRATATADPRSVMCYELPGSITTDGNEIVGGQGLDASDLAFVRVVYPPAAVVVPPVVVPPVVVPPVVAPPVSVGSFTTRVSFDLTCDPNTKTVTAKQV